MRAPGSSEQCWTKPHGSSEVVSDINSIHKEGATASRRASQTLLLEQREERRDTREEVQRSKVQTSMKKKKGDELRPKESHTRVRQLLKTRLVETRAFEHKPASPIDRAAFTQLAQDHNTGDYRSARRSVLGYTGNRRSSQHLARIP